MKRTIATLFASALIGQTALAQEVTTELIPEESATDVLDTGWRGTLTLGASGSTVANKRVVGQADGASVTLGASITGEAEYLTGPHEVRLRAGLEEYFTRTPVIDEFVKTADNLNVEAIYFYHIPAIDWLGPFGRLAVDTPLFKGFDVRADESTYTISRVDGTVDTRVSDRLLLTESFQPATLRQSVGMFARPVREEQLVVDIRVGAGAREIAADGALVVTDDDATDVIEVTEIENYSQVGLESVLELTGTFDESRLSYFFTFESLLPFYDSADDADQSVTERADLEIAVGTGVRLVSWASLDYVFRADRLPAILDDWQLSNNLLLTLSYTVSSDE